jgi:hypothetical protein
MRWVLLAAAAMLAVAAPATATPFSWQFVGTTGSASISEIPVGSPVTVTWTLDPDVPNVCGPASPYGLFAGQSVTVDITTPGGILTYQATGSLLAGSQIGNVCGELTNAMELRLPSWSGPPSFADAFFLGAGMGYPPGLFYSRSSPSSAFPLSDQQPTSATWNGPVYMTADGTVVLQSDLRAVEASEPAPLTLVAIGAAFAALTGRRRVR